MKTEVVGEATGEHDYEVEETKEPTCAEAGSTTSKCTVCGDVKTEEVGEPTDEHDFSNGICLQCGKAECEHERTKLVPSADKKTHNRVCADCETVLEEGLAHSFGRFGTGTCNCGLKKSDTCEHVSERVEYTEEASCTYEGCIQIRCSSCRYVFEETILPIDPDAHYFDGDVCYLCGYNATTGEYDCLHPDPVFTDNGNGTHTVTCDCGELNEVESHYYSNGICYDCNYQCPHENFEELNEAATCANRGYYVRYCTECDYDFGSYTRYDIDPENHVNVTEYDEPSTCVWEGYYVRYCEDCNAEIEYTTKPLDPDTHWFNGDVCADCGYNSVTGEYECLHKEYTYTNNGDGTHTITCDACSEVLETNEEHYYSPFNGRICSCGAECSHENTCEETYNSTCTFEGSIDIYCEDCGLTISSTPIEVVPTAHYFENEGDIVCAHCGYNTETGETICPHVNTESKDNGDGTHNTTCNQCGEVLATNVAHSFGRFSKTCSCGAAKAS